MLKSITPELTATSSSARGDFLDLRDVCYGVSWVRLFVYTIGFLYGQILQINQSDFLTLSIWQPTNIIVFFGMVVHLIYMETIRFSDLREAAVSILFVADVVLIAALMWFTGIYHSVFLFLLLMNVAIATVALGFLNGIKISIFGLAAFHFVWALNSSFDPEKFSSPTILAYFSILVVLGMSGLLSRQMQVVKKDYKEITEEIETLQNINDLIVDHIPSGLIVFGPDLIIKKANRGAAKIFSDLGLEGKYISQLSVDFKMAAENFIYKENTNKISRVEVNHFNFRRERMILEVLFSSVPDKGTQSYMCLIQNLTEVKNLEFIMKQREKLAAVGQLAAGIAHEIRNPLASISGSVQLLSATLVTQTEEDRKLLNIVTKEIDRLNRLITEFLDFVRPEVRVEDPINVSNLIKEVLDIVKMHPQLSKKVEQHTEFRSNHLVFGHYDKLKQALLNIVINSYQALNDTLRPEVTAQTFEADGKLVLVLKDNGSGISGDNLTKIFEPFHTTKNNGTGLGLAITHKILEAHRADVVVESDLGQGTKFIIKFPIENKPNDKQANLQKQA